VQWLRRFGRRILGALFHSGHPFWICGVQSGTGAYSSLVHPALVLRPSCFPKKLGVNKKLYSHQK
jgi:hypothetical protein